MRKRAVVLPGIDGHNDLPEQLRARYGLDLGGIDLRFDARRLLPPPRMPADTPGLMTNLPRLTARHVGGQFWSVWIPTTVTGPAAVLQTIEQIDLVKRMAQRYPDRLAMAYSADDIERQFKAGRVAALIGIEGGHQVDHSLVDLSHVSAETARDALAVS